jgi:hypothetical protein
MIIDLAKSGITGYFLSLFFFYFIKVRCFKHKHNFIHLGEKDEVMQADTLQPNFTNSALVLILLQ